MNTFLIICKNYKRAKQLYYRFISLVDVNTISKVDGFKLEITLKNDGSIMKFVSEASGILYGDLSRDLIPINEGIFEKSIETFIKEHGGSNV